MRKVTTCWSCDVCGKEHPSDEDKPEPCPSLIDVAVSFAGTINHYRVIVQVCHDDLGCHAKAVAIALERMRQARRAEGTLPETHF